MPAGPVGRNAARATRERRGERVDRVTSTKLRMPETRVITCADEQTHPRHRMGSELVVAGGDPSAAGLALSSRDESYATRIPPRCYDVGAAADLLVGALERVGNRYEVR
jgi:hypothetical protein